MKQMVKQIFLLIVLAAFLGCDKNETSSISFSETLLERDSENKPPVVTSANTVVYSGNRQGGNVIDIEAYDTDGDKLSYYLVESDGRFAIDEDSGELFLLPSPYMNLEPSMELLIVVSDGKKETIHKLLVEVDFSFGFEELHFIENSKVVIGNDYLKNYTISKNATFSLKNDHEGLFIIDPNSGFIDTTVDSIDRERYYYFDLEILVKADTESTIHLKVTMDDINDNAPHIYDEGVIYIDENVHYLFSPQISDADYYNSDKTEDFILSISGEDSSSFMVDGRDIFFTEKPNYENKKEYSFTLIVDDGVNQTTKDFTVYINNRDLVITEEIIPNTTIEESEELIRNRAGFSLETEGDYFIASYYSKIADKVCGFAVFTTIDEYKNSEIEYIYDSHSECSSTFANSVAMDNGYIVLSSGSLSGAEIHKIDSSGIVEKVSEISINGAGEDFTVDIDDGYIVLASEETKKVYIYKLEADEAIFVTEVENQDIDSYFRGVKIKENYLAFSVRKDYFSSVKVYKLNKETSSVDFLETLQGDGENQWSDFGYSIEMDDGFLFIGALQEERADSYWKKGSVYLYKIDNDTVVRINKLESEKEDDLFGVSVSLKDNILGVGSFEYGATFYQFNRDEGSFAKLDNFNPYLLGGALVSIDKYTVAYYHRSMAVHNSNTTINFLIIGEDE